MTNLIPVIRDQDLSPRNSDTSLYEPNVVQRQINKRGPDRLISFGGLSVWAGQWILW